MRNRAVFINCPFSDDYKIRLRAITYAIVRSGFNPRCALENDDGAEIRFDKLCKIISECPFGVHDISLTDADPETGLPRFNMPFELGLFLGAKRFDPRQRLKRALILDRDAFRYQQFLSDIAGQDVHAYGGEVGRLVEEVATFLRNHARGPAAPGGRAIASEFNRLDSLLPDMCRTAQLHLDELTFKDYRGMAAQWIVSEFGV